MPAHNSKIDWYQVFADRMANATFLGEGSGYWDKRAPLICGGPQNNPFVTQTLKRLRLLPTDTVLDLGAGNGALTVPLSRKVKSVTALDNSPGMLKILRQRAREGNAANIRVLRRDWLNTEIGRDLPVHDVVVASRCLPMGDLRVSLPKILKAGRRAWFIIWRVSDRQEPFAAAAAVLGKPYQPFPEYTLLAGLLYDLGIYANIEIYTTRMKRYFTSLDEAADEAVRGTSLTARERPRLRNYLQNVLTHECDGWSQDLPTRWALLWWEAGNGNPDGLPKTSKK
jgi:SAM-dependent methyltransferase